MATDLPQSVAGEPVLEVQPLLGGGQHNRCLLLRTAAARFVWRERLDTGDRPGASARQELRCHLAAASLGIAPAVIDAATDGQWLLMAYVDAPRWHADDLHDPGRLETLGRCLAQLHALSPQGVDRLDVRAIVEGQAALIRRRDPAATARVEALCVRALQLDAQIAALAVPAVLNHGDLAAANLLGPEPRMVDWEYAQLADPVYDIACLLSYYPEIETQVDRLLASSGLDDARSRASLALHRQLFEVFNRLWAEAQGASHGDPAGIVLRPSAE